MGFTALVNLRVLKLKPPMTGAAPAATNYLHVRDLTQLISLTCAVPVLHPVMMQSIGMLTGLQVGGWLWYHEERQVGHCSHCSHCTDCDWLYAAAAV